MRSVRVSIGVIVTAAVALAIGGVVVGVDLSSRRTTNGTTAMPAAPMGDVVGGPPRCWVGWEPSEGSVSFANMGANETLMTFRLKWRPEDLTFKTCRERAAFEFEVGFNLANSKLGNFSIANTDLPRTYIDSSRDRSIKDVTFGIADANLLSGNTWYSLTYKFSGRLGGSERLFADASRGYLLKPCAIPPYSDAVCVAGWTEQNKFGPDGRVHLIPDGTAVHQGQTISWSFPTRGSLVGKIIRDPGQGDTYLMDAAFQRHWIPTGAIYNCLVASGAQVVNSFGSPSLSMRWLINSFDQAADASCAAPPVHTVAPTLTQGSVAPITVPDGVPPTTPHIVPTATTGPPTAPANRTAITSYDQMRGGAPYWGRSTKGWQGFTAASNTITQVGVTWNDNNFTHGVVLSGVTTRISLCTAIGSGSDPCVNRIADGNATVMNTGETSYDFGDIAVTPGVTYYIFYYQPDVDAGNWDLYWWNCPACTGQGRQSAINSDQNQFVIRGYNR